MRVENFDPAAAWWWWPRWPECLWRMNLPGKLYGLEYSGGRLEEEKDLRWWWPPPEMEDGISFVAVLMAALQLLVLWRPVMAVREKTR